MIFVSNAAKFFNGKALFSDVDISIHRGDRVGIIGPNGAGKSTLLGMMEGAVLPDQGKVSIEKRIRMGALHQELIQGNDGPIIEEVINVSEELRVVRERLAEVEYLMASRPETLADEGIIDEHARLTEDFERYGGYTLEARALKVLGGLGFKQEDGKRSWSEFSGGWRMRVALAKILLAEPDVLLLDEPTNHLDLESLLWVEEYLAGFKGALVLVSHDRDFLNKLVTRLIEIERGKAVQYTGNFDQYERMKLMQEDVLVATYKSQQDKIKKIEKFIAQNRVKARSASRAQSRIKMLDKMERVEPPPRVKTVRFTFPQPPPSGRRVVEITDLVKKYEGLTVYNGFSMGIDRGDRIGLVGPNGAGKSTLMKIIAGVIPHDSGAVKYGHQVSVGYFAQHQYEALFNDRTALEEAQSAASGMPEQEIRSLLGAFLFSGDDVFKKVKVLSGGEKSRLALSKILLAPPNLLLMDEPTNHLDIASCEVLEQGLNNFDGTLVLITHDRRLMNAVCTGILEIEPGKAEFFPGNYEDYQYKKRLMEKEEALAAQSEPAPVRRVEAVSEGNGSRKEKKRREAESRSFLRKRTAPLRKEISVIEETLQKKESRRKEIEDLLANPEIYAQKEKILPLLEESPSLDREIKAMEAQWEELHEKLAEIENETQEA